MLGEVTPPLEEPVMDTLSNCTISLLDDEIPVNFSLNVLDWYCDVSSSSLCHVESFLLLFSVKETISLQVRPLFVDTSTLRHSLLSTREETYLSKVKVVA